MSSFTSLPPVSEIKVIRFHSFEEGAFQGFAHAATELLPFWIGRPEDHLDEIQEPYVSS